MTARLLALLSVAAVVEILAFQLLTDPLSPGMPFLPDCPPNLGRPARA